MISLQAVDIGTKESHNLRVECTDTDCTEMVAAIRHRSPGDNATVLVGLAAGRKVDDRLVYTTRSVTYTPYFQTFYGYGRYSRENSCSEDNNDNSWTGFLIGLFGEDIVDGAKDKVGDEVKDFIKDIF